MAVRNVKKSPKSINDLEVASDYLHFNASLRIAKRFLEAADKTFTRLAAIPSLGAYLDTEQLFAAGVRTWVVKGFERYVILYREIPDGIEVLRVLHGARKWEEMIDEE